MQLELLVVSVSVFASLALFCWMVDAVQRSKR
jgi:hypothetical protein